MRTIAPSAEAALSGAVLPLVLLVFMDLTAPLYLTTAGFPISSGGNTYLPTGDLGAVEAVDDTPGETKALRFSLSGVSNNMLAIALNEPVRNRDVVISTAIMDPVTLEVLDVEPVWSGTLDQMPIETGVETSVISVTAQHRGVNYARPKVLRYTDADQQRLYPGDTSLRFVAEQAAHQDIWPAASFFRV